MLKGLKLDWTSLKTALSSDTQLANLEDLWKRTDRVPHQCDVLVIGGGAIGSSIAYWLKKMVYREEFNVGVIEKDPTVRSYERTSS